MTPEERLRAALAHRAGTAARNPDALPQIRLRARRRRWTTRLQVATSAAAAAVLVTGVAIAATGDARRDPDPPVTTPTATTAAPTTPPADRGIGTDEYVALLRDGRLVVTSATTGRINRTVFTIAVSDDPEATYDVVLTPDRTSVLLTTPGTGGCGGIEQVDLRTGVRTPMADGRLGDVNPDGPHLVYVGCGRGDGLVVRSATGAERHIRHDRMTQVGGHTEVWNLLDAVWHADGRRLWVVLEWEETTRLLLLDPLTATTTADGVDLTKDHTTFGVDRAGTDLVFLDRCCYADAPGENELVVRSENGSQRVVVTAPDGVRLGEPQAGPGGDLLYVRDDRLYRYDAATGISTDLGASTALARDW